MTEQNGKDWFADQYEKVIGKPLHRKELTAEEVLKRLKDSAKYRQISEAKSYKTPVPPTGTVYYLEWSDPQITMCTCPDQDCTCRGGVMLPRRKIPRGEKYYKSPLARKLMQGFRKPVPPPSRNFTQRLADVVGVESSIYKDLQRNDILSIRGAEFCTSRCIRYYGAGNFTNFKHLQDKQKLLNKNNKVSMPDNDAGEEGRICDDHSCTVTTQTIVGPDGQFVFGNYSHVLFGTLDETVVRDIEGTELHISSYKCMRDNSRYATDNPCSLDNLISWRDILNMRELKNHLSLIKRNIYSSIFELKETNVPEGNQSTQCEEECVSKKSSEKISIATPYKGVMIKVNKDSQKLPTDQIQHKVPKIKNSSHVMPNTTVPNNSEGLDIHLKENSSVLAEIKQDISLHKEIIHKPSQFEPAEHKIIYDPLINQQQNQSVIQNEKTSDQLFTDLIIKNKTSPYEQISPISADIKSDLKINDIKDTVNNKEIHDEINQIDRLNLKGNQINSQDILHETIVSINSQKIANLSQHINESIENGEVSKQNLSKNRLFKENKIFEDPRNEISNSNIRNFIKKLLYGLSFEHLQKMKINKFAKSFSHTYDTDKISINNEIKSNNEFKKTSKLEIKQDKSNFQYNDKTNCDDDIQFECKQSSDLSNFNIIKSQPESSFRYKLASNQLKSQSRDQMPIIDKEANKLNEPDNGVYNNMNELCTLDKETGPSINTVCNVVTSSDDKIYTVSMHKTHPNSKNHNYVNNSCNSKLLQLESKNNYISECKSKDIALCDSDCDNNRMVAEMSLCLGKDTSKEESKKSVSVTKKVSNGSIQLKKLICRKIDHSIKSLPERTLLKQCRKSYNTRINMSEIDHRTCAKCGEKECNEEPKTSEKEVFSIQYSALLS